MASSTKVFYLNSARLLGYLVVFFMLAIESSRAYPSASVNLFSNTNKFGNKLTATDESAEQSFHEFIHSKSPDSTIIGEIKPNASALELMLLKNKIANTILSMQEMERAQANLNSNSAQSLDLIGADCFIEVTRIEKIPGKCHKVGGGLPVCQSDNYMAISSDCN